MNDDTARAVLTDNLQALLREKNISVRQLAKQVGDPLMTIHNAVAGSSLPRAGILVRIADALQVSVDSLFDSRKKAAKSA